MDKFVDCKGLRIYPISYQLEIKKWVPKSTVIKIGTAPSDSKELVWNEARFYKDSKQEANLYAIGATKRMIDNGNIDL